MKFLFQLLIVLCIYIFIQPCLQNDLKVLYITANVENQAYNVKNNVNLLNYLKTDEIKKQINSHDVFVIALQESKKANLVDEKIKEIQKLYDNKTCQVTRKHGPLSFITSYRGLDTVICMSKQYEQVDKIQLQSSLFSMKNISANFRVKGTIGICYSKQESDCLCFMDIHGETNPHKSIDQLKFATEKAIGFKSKKCLNPSLYIVGDWNIRAFLKDELQYQKIEQNETSIINVLKKNDKDSWEQLKQGDTKAINDLSLQFNKLKINNYKLYFPGNSEFQNGKFSYKYISGTSTEIDTEGNKGLKVGKIKKKSQGHYVYPLGWLDKLGCISEKADCDVSGVTYEAVPQLKIGDHMPEKISFIIKGKSRRFRLKKNVKKQKRLHSQ